MIEGLFSNTNYVAAKQLMDVTMLRHEAIASNLANLETPGYKRMDVSASFQDQLQKAVAMKDQDAIRSLRPTLAVDTTAKSLRPDGNTVQLESEMLRLTQNSMDHALESHLITGNLLRIRTAIIGRNS